MIIANEVRETYRGRVIVAVPSATVWGYRIETEAGEVISSRPNGALSSGAAINLAREAVDEAAPGPQGGE